jgi:type IV pilus assembly protein PilM
MALAVSSGCHNGQRCYFSIQRGGVIEMAFGLFSKQDDLVGIDIGSSSVKLIQLRQVKDRYELVHLGMAALPPETIVDHSVMDSVTVVDCLRGLVENQNVKTKNVATSVSGHSVIIRNIYLSVMTSEEVEASIEWEAEQYIPFEISEVNLDFQILGPDSKDPDQMKVLLVAAKKEFIQDYLTVFGECGLTPVVVDVDCFAVENAYQLNYDPENGLVALLNIGASSMNINILKDGVSVFTRDIQNGGNLFNEELQKRLGLNNEEAERVKLGEITGDVDAATVAEVLRYASETLAQEIQRSLDFFAATSVDGKAGKLYLAGGVARTAELDVVIGRQLGIPVEILDPFRRINIDENRFDPAFVEAVRPLFAVGVGLATRRVGDK